MIMKAFTDIAAIACLFLLVIAFAEWMNREFEEDEP